MLVLGEFPSAQCSGLRADPRGHRGPVYVAWPLKRLVSNPHIQLGESESSELELSTRSPPRTSETLLSSWPTAVEAIPVAQPGAPDLSASTAKRRS